LSEGSQPRYTHGHHESVLRSHRWRTAENSAAYLVPHLRPGQDLLDVGCGPGTLTLDLAALVAPGRVTAVEPTSDALDLARAEAGRRGVDGVGFVVADVHALDLPSASYDVVHAHQVLQHVADPVAALREMRRVARPGGLVAVRDSDYAAFAWHPQLPELDAWLALYQRLARANGGEPDAGRRLLAWARAAGFADVTPSASIWCFATPDDRAFWGGMWAARILDSDLARQALASGTSEAELRAISAAWQAWAAAEDGWLAVPHGEILVRA
jgi:SAM-dependent methyltransferase